MKLGFRNAFAFISLLGIILFSCRKGSSDPESNQTDSALFNKITAWLNIQKEKFKDSTSQKAIITLRENLIASELTTETLNDNETIVIVALKNDFKTSNITNQKSLKYLVIRKREDYGFTIGSIIEIIPKNQRFDKVPQNLISKIYNEQQNELNGIFSALTLTNEPLYEKEFKDGKIFSLSYLSKKKKITGGKESVSENANDCVDYYWITYVDGVIVSEQYVFTICGGIEPCRSYRTFESKTPLIQTGCGGGDGSSNVTTTNISSTDSEEDPESAGAPTIYYTLTATLQMVNGEVYNVLRFPATASPMISNYIDDHGRNTTRTLTLFGQGGSWMPLSATSGTINWFWFVFGHWVYTNGNPSYSRQWPKSYTVAY